MKKLIHFTLVSVAVLFFGCSNDSNNTGSANSTAPAASPVAAVQHYTCPNNCVGSGGDAAGTCPVCGTAYVHNAAYHANDPASASTPIDPSTLSGANNSGVPHYICSAGCGGSGAASGNCPNCGAALAHNQAFHNTPGAAAPAPAAPSAGAISPLFQNQGSTPSATMPSPVPPPPAPAQNSAGVYHYTCSAGCGGGGGAAGNCPNCGSALAHNQAYHN